jgi:hypothetical protein
MKRRRQPGKGSFARCVEEVSRRGGVDDPRAVCAASKLKAGEDLGAARRRAAHNPHDLAAEAFERTHGYPSSEETVVIEEEHYHEYMPAWGELLVLLIVPEGQRKAVELKKFAGAKLTFSEHAELPQLEIIGGDQSLDLETLRDVFGKKVLHEKEDLGRCVDVVYYTVKTHLGQEGGDADYTHAFAEETARKQKHVRIVQSPMATYHLLNEKIELWGGVYENTPEGIRD